MLQSLRERSKRTRFLLSQQFGVDSDEGLSRLLGNTSRKKSKHIALNCSSNQGENETSTHHLNYTRQVATAQDRNGPNFESNSYDRQAIVQSESSKINKLDRQRIVPEDKNEVHEEYFNAQSPSLVSIASSDSITSKSTSHRISTSPVTSPTTLTTRSADVTRVYTDSSTFLKGTQSANPHNDYCQHFVDTGQRPQNFIRDVGLSDRFEEYPKLKELIKLKDALIASSASPPMYLKVDLKSDDFSLTDLKGKFDVILIEPPLEEYTRNALVNTDLRNNQSFWSWEEVMSLPIESIAAQRSFIFMWVGSSEGLDLGRVCLKKWGFRRCEDICWIKTNLKNPSNPSKNALDNKAFFQRTKEHCLMGIKGTVRRSTDGDFIHANVDIDLIITEEPPFGCTEKPSEIFNIIEHFCLGRRRLHLFGRDSTIRPGWLTLGSELTHSNFNADAYWAFFQDNYLTGCTERIESLRPKSPLPKNKVNQVSNSMAGGMSPSIVNTALATSFNPVIVSNDNRSNNNHGPNARVGQNVRNRVAS